MNKLNILIILSVVMLVGMAVGGMAVTCSTAQPINCTLSHNAYLEMSFNQTYYFNISESGNLINEFGENTTINCNYSTIIGNRSGRGINIDSVGKNVTIKNCKFANFTYNIRIASMSQATIDNCEFYGARLDDLWMFNVTGFLFKNSRFYKLDSTQKAIYITGDMKNVRITNLTANLTNNGFWNTQFLFISNISAKFGPMNNITIDNNIFDMDNYGNQLNSAENVSIYNNIFNNMAVNETSHVFELDNIKNFLIYNNKYYNNHYAVEPMSYSQNGLIYNNYIDCNAVSASHGIMVYLYSNNVSTYFNNITNCKFGLLHETNSYNLVSYNNSVTNCLSTAFYELHNTYNNTLYNNYFDCTDGNYDCITLNDTANLMNLYNNTFGRCAVNYKVNSNSTLNNYGDSQYPITIKSLFGNSTINLYNLKTPNNDISKNSVIVAYDKTSYSFIINQSDWYIISDFDSTIKYSVFTSNPCVVYAPSYADGSGYNVTYTFDRYNSDVKGSLDTLNSVFSGVPVWFELIIAIAVIGSVFTLLFFAFKPVNR